MNKKSRNQYVELLKKIVKGNDKLAKQIEDGIYCYTEKQFPYKNMINEDRFKKIYKAKYIMIMMNLKNKNNPGLLSNVLNGDISGKELAFKTHQELFPDIWKSRYEEQEQIRLSKMARQIQFTESIYVCRKCKSNKNAYVQLQTRSADEPMTTFVKCICGNSWKC